MPPDLATATRSITARVTGWDLSAITVRRLDPGPAWDYEAEAARLIAGASCVLDCGTGGGEVFGRITRAAQARLVATEQWPPNARLAAVALRPRGIGVAQADSLQLPFGAAAFDLVLSRHEAIEPAEIDRVLRPGGTFLTQQVSSVHWPELSAYFPAKAVFPNHDVDYPAAFEAMGYAVAFQSLRYRSAYASIADLAAMLMVAPWEVPGFDLERDEAALLAVERDLGTGDGIVLSEGRYLLRAQKPA